jgi:hypothetical protein
MSQPIKMAQQINPADRYAPADFYVLGVCFAVNRSTDFFQRPRLYVSNDNKEMIQ